MHHDDALGRLTDGDGRLDCADGRGAEGRAVQGHRRPHADARRIVRSGRRPRAAGDRDQEPVRRRPPAARARTAAVLAGYQGPVAAMSFDPAHGRGAARRSRRGCRAASSPCNASRRRRRARRSSRPLRFVMQVLAAAAAISSPIACRICRPPGAAWRAALLRLPLLTWTVRTRADRMRAEHYADQMIFEGFRP